MEVQVQVLVEVRKDVAKDQPRQHQQHNVIYVGASCSVGPCKTRQINTIYHLGLH
jgi:hypothetical protein